MSLNAARPCMDGERDKGFAELAASGKCTEEAKQELAAYRPPCDDQVCLDAFKDMGRAIVDKCIHSPGHAWAVCVLGHQNPCGSDGMSFIETGMAQVAMAALQNMGTHSDRALSPAIAAMLAGLMGAVLGASLVALYLNRRSVGQPPLLA